jgi:pimeloyl-ACP methyl ester carboxylesterase
VALSVELPGRGTTRVWECPGPPGAETIILVHGVTFTAELNWRGVLEPLGRHFRVLALDQRGHGQGISFGSRFRLEDCADDIAALARAMGVQRFIVAGYSMGGIVAQLVYRRHPSLVSGLVLCATARNVRESPLEHLVAITLPVVVATMAWNPVAHALGAGVLGAVLLGNISDPTTREWAHAQLRRTSLTAAISAVDAVSEFSSDDWIGQVDVPTAVVVTTRDLIVPTSRQRRLAAAIPGAVAFDLDGDHGVCVTAPEAFARVLLRACQSVATSPGPRAEPPVPVAPPAPASGASGDDGYEPPEAAGDVPVATYPEPKANSWTRKFSVRRSKWRHGRSNPSKSAT